MLKVENLHFEYSGFKVLEDISFDVEKGQLCALFGPNGTGKTTLLKCIAKLLNYGKGNVFVENENINKMKAAELAKLIAYVPQEHKPPFPYLVKEVVLMGRTPYMRGVFGPSENDTRAAVEAIEMIGIADIADRPYTALSGGQRQLVLLARAMAQGTKLLLLDEPTSNLDFQNQIKIWRIVKELTKKGVTALTCTHDPNHVMWFCDKAIVLGSRGIVANGNPAMALTETTLNEIYGDVCDVIKFGDTRMIVPAEMEKNI
ncbi:ABC transporter ATP-binding protein [Methanococcoides sp.]|uniref:ABC transporter ATP-binding protein n=1 Tax=Methanococcoides sp. TaxID=1966350 RepID=UPI00272DECAD|nr:ABC transporter ATP-binding protein [Methanococcoides sp.]